MKGQPTARSRKLEQGRRDRPDRFICLVSGRRLDLRVIEIHQGTQRLVLRDEAQRRPVRGNRAAIGTDDAAHVEHDGLRLRVHIDQHVDHAADLAAVRTLDVSVDQFHLPRRHRGRSCHARKRRRERSRRLRPVGRGQLIGRCRDRDGRAFRIRREAERSPRKSDLAVADAEKTLQIDDHLARRAAAVSRHVDGAAQHLAVELLHFAVEQTMRGVAIERAGHDDRRRRGRRRRRRGRDDGRRRLRLVRAHDGRARLPGFLGFRRLGLIRLGGGLEGGNDERRHRGFGDGRRRLLGRSEQAAARHHGGKGRKNGQQQKTEGWT